MINLCIMVKARKNEMHQALVDRLIILEIKPPREMLRIETRPARIEVNRMNIERVTTMMSTFHATRNIVQTKKQWIETRISIKATNNPMLIDMISMTRCSNRQTNGAIKLVKRTSIMTMAEKRKRKESRVNTKLAIASTAKSMLNMVITTMKLITTTLATTTAMETNILANAGKAETGTRNIMTNMVTRNTTDRSMMDQKRTTATLKETKDRQDLLLSTIITMTAATKMYINLILGEDKRDFYEEDLATSMILTIQATSKPGGMRREITKIDQIQPMSEQERVQLKKDDTQRPTKNLASSNAKESFSKSKQI